MGANDWLVFLSQVPFAIAVAIWLLWRIHPELNGLRAGFRTAEQSLARIEVQLRELNRRLEQIKHAVSQQSR